MCFNKISFFHIILILFLINVLLRITICVSLDFPIEKKLLDAHYFQRKVNDFYLNMFDVTTLSIFLILFVVVQFLLFAIGVCVCQRDRDREKEMESKKSPPKQESYTEILFTPFSSRDSGQAHTHVQSDSQAMGFKTRTTEQVI